MAKKTETKASSGAGKLPASWLDDDTHTPLIEQYARRLEHFMTALEDGRIDEGELKAQEARLVKLMQEIEPKLSVELHAQVTEMLCELTAYDVMQCLHTLGTTRPRSVFQG